MKFLKEWTGSVRKNFEQRLSNPLLGAFSVSWVFFNWKAITVLLASNKEIEAKIEFLEQNYSDVNYLLWFPLASSLILTILLPWASYFVQSIQEFVNKKRSLKQIQYDTDLLKAKEELVTIQSKLEHVKASHELELEFSRRGKEIILERDSKLAQHEFEKEHKIMENDFQQNAQRHQFEMEMERRSRELEIEERQQKHQFEMERDKRERELDLEERRQRNQFDMELEKYRMENEFEDRKQERQLQSELEKRNRELEVEKYKANRGVAA
ncbi:hypothetical protein ACJ5M7_005076 [Vibrio harveyi]